ncbi:protein AE7-like 1 [Prunus yedoensis var. nudiflora]|uniref:Protein AE7-like 1 n=1 Tax=Prunus yedoensis var. nudiflora TaxID=2094558 RepID=A0A314YMV1_PRUYE|nr:protein AE7-like 1 [Prunus yedoensis var. nudiflora]
MLSAHKSVYELVAIVVISLGKLSSLHYVAYFKRLTNQTKINKNQSPTSGLDLVKLVRERKIQSTHISLEQLSVLSEESISVDDKLGRILITFTPTIQHCSMATVIGLCLRVKLKHCFPPHYKVDIKVSPGSHANEESVNKQLNDKERVAAALENPNLRQLVDECLYSNEL